MGDIGKQKSEPISWTSLLPEFYYDLISRIPSGIIFIIGIAYTLNNKIFTDLMPQVKDKQLIEPPYLIIFILLLVAGYISGLVFLTTFGDCLGKGFYRSQYRDNLEKYSPEKSKWILKKADMSQKSVGKLNNKEIDKVFQIHHDYTKKIYPYASSRLSKSQAEAKLCINTSAAFILLSILTVLKVICLIWKELFKEIIILAILAITFFVIAFFSRRAAIKRNERFLSLLDSFFLLTVNDHENEKNDDK